jgi:endoglucanase
MTTNIRQSSGAWVPVTPSPDGTLIKAPSLATITTADGVVRGINAAGQVTANGAADLSTWGVVAIGIKGGNFYQMNAAGDCYELAIEQWTQTTSPWTPSVFGLRVSGNNIINGAGTPIQLAGVNISGPEGAADNGPTDIWRGYAPNFAAMKSWGIQIVRIPLAEANWLGLCSSTLAQGMTPANYQAAVQAAVNEANAAGMYVILDLHIIAVPNLCPAGQNAMADTKYSPTFWSQVAGAYKNNPAVMFELFNEPQGNFPPTTADWNNLVSGALTGAQDTGMQAMLNAIRATGATNVVLVDTLNFASTFGNNNNPKLPDNPPGFELPTDTLNPPQLAAAWHYYNTATQYETGANAVLNKGIPIIITEYGDQNNASVDSQAVYGWADPGGRASKALTSGGATFPGVSYLAWTWDAWPGVSSFILITDAAGDPTEGYGSYVKAHYQARAGL